MPTKPYSAALNAQFDMLGKEKVQKILLRQYSEVKINTGRGYDLTAFHKLNYPHHKPHKFDVQVRTWAFNKLWARTPEIIKGELHNWEPNLLNRMLIGHWAEEGYPEAYFYCSEDKEDMRFIYIIQKDIKRAINDSKYSERGVRYNKEEELWTVPYKYWQYEDMGKC